MPKAKIASAGDLVLIDSLDLFGASLAICVQPDEFATKMKTGMAVVRANAMGVWTWHS